MTKQKHFYLIRGLVREAGHWCDFLDILAREFPGARVTTIDLPGSGEALGQTTPLRVEAMVKSMRQKYLRDQAAGEEAIVVSISLGSMVAASWIKSHPEDFQQAVVINTSCGSLSPFYYRLRPGAFISLLKVPWLQGRAREAHIIDLVLNHAHRSGPTLDVWEQVHRARPVAPLTPIRQLIAASRFRIGDWRPSIPVLVIAATHDRMVNVACSRAIARAWGGKLVEHPTGGHELSNDDPDWVIARMKEFLATA